MSEDIVYVDIDEDGEPNTQNGWGKKKKKVSTPRKSPHVSLANKYLTYKGFKYKSQNDKNRALYRYMKPAAELLESHSLEEILDCMKWCDKQYEDKWTLETVVKKIDEYGAFEGTE